MGQASGSSLSPQGRAKLELGIWRLDPRLDCPAFNCPFEDQVLVEGQCCITCRLNFSGPQKEYQERFLILGGLTAGSNLEIEVIDVNSSSTPFGAIPSKRSLAVGGLLDSTPILCGGYNPYEDSCITFKNSQWTKTHEMTTKRGLAASVQLNSTTLWILGGRKADQDYLDSTEFIRADSSFGLQGPKLPKAMHSFCVIKYSEQQVFIIGGRRGNERLNTVYILNPMDDFNYIYGPPLKNSRGDHACGLMSNGQQSKIVVAGGSSKYVDFFFISSVEIFDPTVNNWITGKEIHFFKQKKSIET